MVYSFILFLCAWTNHVQLHGSSSGDNGDLINCRTCVTLCEAIRSSIWRTGCSWHKQFTRLFDALRALGTGNSLVYLMHWVHLARAIYSSIWRTGCSWHKQSTRLFDALGALGTSNSLVYLTHWVHLAQAIYSSIWRTGCTWHKQFTRLFDALGALGTSNSLVYLTHWVLLVRLWLEEWRWQSCFNSQPVQRIMHHDSSSGQVQRLIHHDSSSGQVQRIIHHCHNWYLKHKEPNVISNNCFPHVVKVSIHDPNPMIRVGQNHAYICIYSEYTVFLAGNLPYIRSCTVHTYGSGQP